MFVCFNPWVCVCTGIGSEEVIKTTHTHTHTHKHTHNQPTLILNLNRVKAEKPSLLHTVCVGGGGKNN